MSSSSRVSLKWCEFALLYLLGDDDYQSAFAPLLPDVGDVLPIASTVSDPSSSADFSPADDMHLQNEFNNSIPTRVGPFPFTQTGQGTFSILAQSFTDIFPCKENRPHNELDYHLPTSVELFSSSVPNPVFAPSSDVGDGRISPSTASDHSTLDKYIVHDRAPLHKRTDHLFPHVWALLLSLIQRYLPRVKSPL